MVLDRIVLAGAGRTVETVLDRLLNLAPVLVLDTAQAALDELSLPPPDSPGRHQMTRVCADATSRLTLEDARTSREASVGLVAATGNDRRNLEVCRLAGELGFQPVVALVIDPARAADYVALGARPIVRAQILGRVVEQALRYDGLVAASTVGLGRGEIVEFSVLPSSPAVGLPLAELQANGWRVAAIYRAGALVIPTGETVIAPEDRVLLIGDPEILRDVVEQLRIGAPQFPLRFGKRVVLYQPAARNLALEGEAERLARCTRAEGMIRLAPGVQATSAPLSPDEAPAGPVQPRKTAETQPLEGARLSDHLAQLHRLRPGLVVTSPPRRSLVQYLAGRGGTAAELCNAQPCPVLFSSGNAAYARLLYVLLNGAGAVGLADTAIDLARMLHLPLVVVCVELPEYIEERDPQLAALSAEVERRAAFHRVRTERLVLTGNPVRELAHLARSGDLLLMHRRRTPRNSFTSPDVALAVASLVTKAAVMVRTWPTP